MPLTILVSMIQLVEIIFPAKYRWKNKLHKSKIR